MQSSRAFHGWPHCNWLGVRTLTGVRVDIASGRVAQKVDCAYNDRHTEKLNGKFDSGKFLEFPPRCNHFYHMLDG